MKYSVEYDGAETKVLKEDDGEYKTLAEAKKEAIRHLRSVIFSARIQIKNIRASKVSDIESPL